MAWDADQAKRTATEFYDLIRRTYGERGERVTERLVVALCDPDRLDTFGR
jgi:hypothetical protein